MAFHKKRPIRKRKVVKRKTYAKKKVAAPLRALVQREIARNVENKTIEVFKSHYQLYSSNSAAFATQNVIPLCFSPVGLICNQDTSASGRIGDKVKIKKLRYQGTFFPSPYNSSTNPVPVPLEVKLVLFYDRTAPAYTPAAPQSNWLQFGSTTNTLRNDLVDMWGPVNQANYRVLATKRFKLGYASYGGTTGVSNAPSQAFANNDFKMNYNLNWDVTKYIPSLVHFVQGNSSSTESRGLWMLVIPVAADGTQMAAGTMCMQVQSSLSVFYEDA